MHFAQESAHRPFGYSLEQAGAFFVAFARLLPDMVCFTFFVIVHSGSGLPGTSHGPDRDPCASASKQMLGEAGENGQLVLREDRRFILGCCPFCS